MPPVCSSHHHHSQPMSSVDRGNKKVLIVFFINILYVGDNLLFDFVAWYLVLVPEQMQMEQKQKESLVMMKVEQVLIHDKHTGNMRHPSLGQLQSGLNSSGFQSSFCCGILVQLRLS